MSKHSPGPWEWVPFKNWDGGLRAADGQYVISNDETDNTPENPRDAKLIAAAPALLALLKEMEWMGWQLPNCWACRGWKLGWPAREGKPAIPAGHKPDCRLKLLLAECGEQHE